MSSTSIAAREAKSGGYATVELELTDANCMRLTDTCRILRDYQLSLCLSVPQARKQLYVQAMKSGDSHSVCYIFESRLRADDYEFLNSIRCQLKLLRCRVKDPDDLHRLLQSVPECYYSILEVEFSYHKKALNDECKLIQRNLCKVKQLLPDVPIRPPQHTEVPNPDAVTSRSTEPTGLPVFKKVKSTHKKSISIIVPTFNNWSYLQKTLTQFEQQTLQCGKYEVIVVDDGSNDETVDELQIALSRLPCCSTLLRHPRTHTRRRGEGQYSAGIARNYGVKHASAEILFFLDSDIIIPPTMLEDLLELHKRYDLIQGKRVELRRRETDNIKSIMQVETQDSSSQFEDSLYWGSFYEGDEDWAEQLTPWQHVCSHSLSVKKRHFLDCGRFRKTFCYYGFEDTDLGYRLYKSGLTRFHLYEKPIFHCYQSKELSEYGNSQWKKLTVLRKSARVFYRNTLDDDVFNQCEPFFRKRTPKTIFRHFIYTVLEGLGQVSLFKRATHLIFLSIRQNKSVDSDSTGAGTVPLNQ